MKELTKYRHILLIITFGSLFSACRVTRDYKRPAVKTNSLYRDRKPDDTATMANLPWKSIFRDTTLQKLITEGLVHNLDLKIAVASMQESAATFKQTKAAFLPNLNGDASIAETRPSGAQGYTALNSYRAYQVELSSSWEADIWGKLKSSKKAAYANFLKSDAYKRAVLTQLIANIADDYYALLAYDQQLSITEQTVKNRLADEATVKILKDGDVVTGADVVQSVANRYSASVTIPDLKVSIRETENALCVLLGRDPGSVERSVLQDQQPLQEVFTGVPLQLLSNRPDVQEAEFTLMNAFETTNIAHTNFYPALTLSATGGLSRTSLNNFFSSSSVFGNVVSGLTQPIFNNGVNKAQLRIAQAQQQEALFSFQKSLLTAGQEVSDALFSYQMALQKTGDRSEQLKALEKSVNYTKQLLKYTSATNYTDVLTAEQNLLAAQLNGVNDKLQQLQGIVNLYRALGGGWK